MEPLRLTKITDLQSKLVRYCLQSTPGYDNLVRECPSFGRAVDALPDLELVDFTNVFLRDLLSDAIAWAIWVTEGSYP